MSFQRSQNNLEQKKKKRNVQDTAKACFHIFSTNNQQSRIKYVDSKKNNR